MSAQTWMGSTTATIDGHGEEQSSLRIASGRTSGMTGAGHLSGNATATSQAKLSRTGAVVEVDSIGIDETSMKIVGATGLGG